MSDVTVRVRLGAMLAMGLAVVFVPAEAFAQTLLTLNTGSSVSWNTTLWSDGGLPPQTATQVGQLTGGGTMTIDASSTNTSPDGLLIGWTGNFNVQVTGGTLTTGTSTSDGSGTFGLTVGESGTGTFTQTGGLVTAPLVNLGRLTGGSGTYTLSGGTLSTSQIARGIGGGTLNLNGGTIRVSGTSSALIGTTVTTVVQGGRAIIDTNGFDATIASAMSGTGGFTKNGSGTLVLTNDSVGYTGTTIVNTGILQIGNNNSVTTLPTGSYSIAAGAKLVLSRNGGEIRFQYPSFSGAGDVEFQGNAVGTYAFKGAGTGLPVYGGVLSYTGQTIVNTILTSSTGSQAWRGSLWLEKDNVLPNATVVNMQSGKIYTRSQNGTGLSVAGITGSAGTFITTDAFGGTQKWTVTVASGSSFTFAGVIGWDGQSYTTQANGNNISFTKAGAGTQIFSGVNTYSGSTTITNGRLEIASSGRINGTAGITINGSGAELKYNSATALSQPITFTQGTISGTGTIGTAVTVATNDILAPGNSAGAQGYSAGLTWSPGGTYQWEINDALGAAGLNWDILNVSGGALNLSGLATENRFILDLITLTGTSAGPMANYIDGQSYTFALASYTALTLPTGFSGNDLTSLFSLSFAKWENPAPSLANISVVNNTAAGTIDLVIVPEPNALALAGIAVAVAGWSLRRRRVAV